MTDVEDGLKRIAEAVKKMPTPRYCETHKPCDAKEHQQGYALARSLLYAVFGSLVFGLVLMFGVNLVFASWLEVVPGMGYGTAIMGTASLYVLRLIAKL